MKRKIQETFDMIHADEKLKDRTREFLASSRARAVLCAYYSGRLRRMAALFQACIGDQY